MLIVITRYFPFTPEHEAMLAALTPQDAVLLQADGCYCASMFSGSKTSKDMQKPIIYIQYEDAQARGIATDYVTFVAQNEVAEKLTQHGNWVIW